MEQEIIELMRRYENNEISYKDLYYELRRFPSKLRDTVLALYILGGYEE